MRNPFLGMNPYLEAHWRDVHASLVLYIRNQLQRKLPAGLVARAEEGVAVDDTGEPLTYWPDIQVKQPGRMSPDALHESAVSWSGETEVMDPVLIVAEPETERWVEIRDAGGRVDLAFEDGGYATLDVSRDIEPPLPTEDAQWVDDCLGGAGLRK